MHLILLVSINCCCVLYTFISKRLHDRLFAYGTEQTEFGMHLIILFTIHGVQDMGIKIWWWNLQKLID